MFGKAGILFLLCLVYHQLQAQDHTLKCRWLQNSEKPILLDSLSVDSHTIFFPDHDSLPYDYNYTRGTIEIRKDLSVDSLRICYRVLPFSFHRTYQNRSIHQYDSNALFLASGSGIAVKDQRDQLFKTEDLYKSGSITRGISFGNQQDVFVNSNLNLQLEGKLNDQINILATITDQDIPFQPEGNTQQLQDFDKVFIQLYNKHLTLSAGDIVLQNRRQDHPDSYFLKYYKNVQGGIIESRYNLMQSLAKTSLGVSVAKGKFASMQVEPIDGVQGPYRLKGPENQRFIMVLANSEKVYLDGQLLTRGFNKHYTIDYNIGEITFTNRVLITKFSRIRVDFEYSDQNYQRQILTGGHQQQWGRTNIFMKFFQEKDNPNRPLSFDLAQQDLGNLIESGDDPVNAFISGIDSLGFSEQQVSYALVDTIDATGREQSVLYFSTDPAQAHYRAVFTEVGMGNGQYQLLSSTVNGKIYQWVGLDSAGIPQGNYDPLIPVTTPKLKNMLTLGATHTFDSSRQVYAEIAFSGNDQNLYSRQDDSDNGGHAVRLGYRSDDRPLFMGLSWSHYLDYQFTSRNFRGIDRFRSIEFDRDWSVESSQLEAGLDDHLITMGIQLKQDPTNRLHYQWIKRHRMGVVEGNQHHLDLVKSFKRWVVSANVFGMSNQQRSQRSQWNRFTINTSYDGGMIIPGYEFQMDRNRITNLSTDSVIASAMNFQSHRFYLQDGDSLGVQFLLDYSYREDKIPIGGILVDNDRSHTTNLRLSSEIGKSHHLEWLLTYRQLSNLRSSDAAANDETLNIGLDWRGSFLDQHIRGELNYQMGNSRELRREFIFINVPTGEGTHTWRDENSDGIQDLDEFYLAINPDERNYAKFFTPTDDYVPAFSNMVNFRMSLEMPRNWKTVPGLKAFLSKFSALTSWNALNKFTDEDLAARLSPFKSGIEPTTILSSRENFRATGFYNRGHTRYGLDFGFVRSVNQQLLVEGFESRGLKESHINFRYNLSKPWIFQLTKRQRTRETSSDFLTNRNYVIDESSWIPQLSWQPNQKIRVTTRYERTERGNTHLEGDGESSKIDQWTLEVRQNQSRRSTLQAQVSATDIRFKGVANTAVGYELLQALQPGTNIIWSANWQLKIGAGLQLLLNYHGRNTPGGKSVHTGRMQVTALF